MKLPYSVRVGIIRAESAAAVEAVEYLRLPALSGSEAQAAWGEGIRARLIIYLKATLAPDAFSEAISFLRSVTTSRDWIDRRDVAFDALLGELQRLKAARLAQSQTDLSLAHDGAKWYAVHVNRYAALTRTPGGILLRMPKASALAGWSVWVRPKAVIKETGFELILRLPSDKLFPAIRKREAGRLDYDRKKVTFEEFACAWGNKELLP